MKKKVTLRESEYLDKVPNSNIGLYKKYGTPIISRSNKYSFKIGDPVYLKQHKSVGFLIDGPTEEDPDFPEKGLGWGGEARTDVDGVQSLKYMVPFDAAKHSKADIPPSIRKVLFKESSRSKVRGIITQLIREEVKRALSRRRLRESKRKDSIKEEISVDKSNPKNIETGVSNIFLKGAGYDTNGNMRIVVGLPNDRGISIQTNGNLPKTDSIFSSNGGRYVKLHKLTDEEIKTIGKEVTQYIQKYGTGNTKKNLSVYGTKAESNQPKFSIKESLDSGYTVTYYATVGQHGDTGKQYPDYKSALRDAIKNSEDPNFMDGLEYLGVEPFGDENRFAILYIEDRYLNNVANYIEGAKNKQIWKSVAQKVLQGQEKSGGKLVVPQSGAFVNENLRKSKTSIKEAYGLHPDVLRQYLETALWSSTDESDESGGEPFDANYSIEDIAPESVAQAKKDIEKFIQMAEDEGVLNPYLDAFTGPSWGNLGHDFWLTRNHHGAGFWDRSEIDDEVGKKLTDISQKFREVTPILGDDGKIYFE
jgi:hypothetical protein